MMFLRCPECGELLGFAQIVWEEKVTEIMALPIPYDNREELKAEVAKLLVTKFCCRGHLITYCPVVHIAS
jgi:DNA-directed RNA polymerase subunit N (RpoN/RPB10)